MFQKTVMNITKESYQKFGEDRPKKMYNEGYKKQYSGGFGSSPKLFFCDEYH